MASKIITGVIIGGGIGFAIGYFGHCSTGTCPLTSNYYVSTILGALVGAMLAAGSPSGPAYSDASITKSEHVQSLDAANFDEFIRGSDSPALVDFYSPRCGPCRRLAPVFDELADAYAGRVRFGKLDVMKYGETAGRFDVNAVPALIMFKQAKPVGKPMVGFRDVAAIREALDAALE